MFGGNMAKGGESEQQLSPDVMHSPALDLANSTTPMSKFISIYCQEGFLYPLWVSVWGPVNLTDNRQNKGGKNTNCFKYFTCTGVHRKEMKLKEVVRLWGLDTILTKKRVWVLRNK